MGNFLDRWIELTHIDQTFAGLYDLVKREQFMNCCSKEMNDFIKEKECKNMTEVIKWAKTCVQAHGLHNSQIQIDRYIKIIFTSTTDRKISLVKNTCVRTKGYSTDLLDPTQVESKNTIVKSNGLSRVLMLNLWIFSLEKNKIRKLWLK